MERDIRENFITLMEPEPDHSVRFVIRDRTGVRPSIHGIGRSWREAQLKVEEILAALDHRQQAAA